MDKSKFTANPELDSEGFVKGNEQIDAEMDYRLRLLGYGKALDAFNAQRGAITLHDGATVTVTNPPGWNEPGMQQITWCEDMHEEMFRG